MMLVLCMLCDEELHTHCNLSLTCVERCRSVCLEGM